MNFRLAPARRSFAAAFAIFAFSLVAVAQEASPAPQADVKIKNFGQMDERFYRGAKPKREEYQALKDLGINTVIDLRAETKGFERETAESLGMRYVNIPMVAKKYPTQEQVGEFLRMANDPATGKFYLHCAGGRHRTGVMGAVYRFEKNGWDLERAYREMKNFDFYTSWGHGDFKDFVENYWQQLQARQPQQPQPQQDGVKAAAATVHTGNR